MEEIVEKKFEFAIIKGKRVRKLFQHPKLERNQRFFDTKWRQNLWHGK
jgi:hypothetical protein